MNLCSSPLRCHNFKACAPAWMVDMSALQAALCQVFAIAVCNFFLGALPMPRRRWSSGAPCTAGECFVGFSWESDGTRHRRGTTAEIVRACALHVEDPRGELQADARLPNGWLCPAGDLQGAD